MPFLKVVIRIILHGWIDKLRLERIRHIQGTMLSWKLQVCVLRMETASCWLCIYHMHIKKMRGRCGMSVMTFR